MNVFVYFQISGIMLNRHIIGIIRQCFIQGQFLAKYGKKGLKNRSIWVQQQFI
jgi:hypothetical protein